MTHINREFSSDDWLQIHNSAVSMPIMWKMDAEVADALGTPPQEPVIELLGNYHTPFIPFIAHIRDSLAERNIEPLQAVISEKSAIPGQDPVSIETVDLRLTQPAKIEDNDELGAIAANASTWGNKDAKNIAEAFKNGQLLTLTGFTQAARHAGIEPNSETGHNLIRLFKFYVIKDFQEKIKQGEINDMNDPQVIQAYTRKLINSGDYDNLGTFLNERKAQLESLRNTLRGLIVSGKELFPKSFQQHVGTTLLSSAAQKAERKLAKMNQAQLLELSRSLFWESFGLFDEYQVAKKYVGTVDRRDYYRDSIPYDDFAKLFYGYKPQVFDRGLRYEHGAEMRPVVVLKNKIYCAYELEDGTIEFGYHHSTYGNSEITDTNEYRLLDKYGKAKLS